MGVAGLKEAAIPNTTFPEAPKRVQFAETGVASEKVILSTAKPLPPELACPYQISETIR